MLFAKIITLRRCRGFFVFDLFCQSMRIFVNSAVKFLFINQELLSKPVFLSTFLSDAVRFIASFFVIPLCI